MTTGRTVIPAELDDAIARASQLGMAHQVPLLRALRLGIVSAAFVSRAASAIDLNRFGNRPAVVVLQDDDFQASGPAGFPVARKALRWGRAFMLHAAGGEPQHYAALVEAALSLRRVVLIETSADRAEGWFTFAKQATAPRPPRGLVIWPRGNVHPVVPPGAVQ